MVMKIARYVIVLVAFSFVFILGVLVGSSLRSVSKDNNIVQSSISSESTEQKSKILIKEIKSTTIQPKEPYIDPSFSFAYNGSHLWSIRVADENYYRLIHQLPCRSVDYQGGPTMEKMSPCDPVTIREFSVNSSIAAQKWLYEHQNPANCADKKFAIIHTFAWSGFGSTMHQVVWAFGMALAEERIAVYRTPGNWLYASCSHGTPDCLFLPISNCTTPSSADGNRTINIKADLGHWPNPVFPKIFQNRSFNWYRSQLLFYLMRYKPETLTYVQNMIAQNFVPPSLDVHRPYLTLFVRRTDKVHGHEMTRIYSMDDYFTLFESDARQVNISTIYMNSEDPKAFEEYNSMPKKRRDAFKLLTIKSKKEMLFLTLAGMSPQERQAVALEFLTDLFIEVHADLHAGTLTSNWCRLIDEIRFVLGKYMTFYTPENRFLIDM